MVGKALAIPLPGRQSQANPEDLQPVWPYLVNSRLVRDLISKNKYKSKKKKLVHGPKHPHLLVYTHTQD